MTDFIPINDNDVFIFNRLATLSSERHDPLPLRKFFSDSTLESNKLVEQELESAIMDLNDVKCAGEPCCPERAIAFSLEYIPWADHNGEHDDILTTTIIGEIDQDLGLALISHIVTTGDPMSATDRVDAADLGMWVLTTQVTHGIIGIVLGAAGMILAQLAVFTF